ncbi:MAG TPA: hypothetical protein VE420_10755 [Gemmatimonadales bacterium]|nr:hypothetical protein [Gemmatimonadales bacterium]
MAQVREETPKKGGNIEALLTMLRRTAYAALHNNTRRILGLRAQSCYVVQHARWQVWAGLPMCDKDAPACKEHRHRHEFLCEKAMKVRLRLNAPLWRREPFSACLMCSRSRPL